MSAPCALKFFGRTVTPEFEKKSWGWALFIASYVFLLGFKRTFTLTAVALMLVGIRQVFILVRQLKENGIGGLPDAYKNYTVLFSCLCVPLLLSLPDAQYASAAVPGTLKLLFYFFIGIAVIWAAREKQALHPLMIIFVALACFWAADVILQRITGYDVFGKVYFPAEENRAGAYFANPVKFGAYLASFSILALTWLGPRLAGVKFFLLWMLFAIAMFCNMARAGMFVFGLFSLPLLYFYVVKPLKYSWAFLLLGMVAGLFAAHYLYLHDAAFHNRVIRTLAFTNGMTYENWDTALTYRLDLWRGAWLMFQDNWLNGMGLQAFNNNFPAYAQSEFWKAALYPTHEHQYILQILDTAGIIGFIGLIAFYAFMVRFWRRSSQGRDFAFPLLMVLFSLWFPLGTHHNFYSSEFLWFNLIFMGLIVAALDARKDPVSPQQKR